MLANFSILHFKIYNLLTSVEDLRLFLATSAGSCLFRSDVIVPAAMTFLSATGVQSQVTPWGKTTKKGWPCVLYYPLGRTLADS